ncbi:MAG: DUF5615 family PIN-like protein [Chitinophagaceae bacterium]|nr:DUF5615 family PIN-like protein [Chitinophagaceae bacterium]
MIDETLPFFVPILNEKNFRHVSSVKEISSDTDIWNYALANNQVIVTRDSDFYYRYMDNTISPKIIWIDIRNMKKRNFIEFIELCWPQVEAAILIANFIIVDEEKIETI